MKTRWQDRYTKLLKDEMLELNGAITKGGEEELLALLLTQLVSIDTRLQLLLEQGEEECKEFNDRRRVEDED